jgi:hypothetical protein
MKPPGSQLAARKVGKSFYIRQLALSLSPPFCALINHSTSTEPLYHTSSCPRHRPASHAVPSLAVTSYDRARASNGLACHRSPSHDATMKSCHPEDQGLGWEAVLQSLHDSRCAYLFLYFSYVTHWILLYCESTGRGLGFAFVWHWSSYTAEKACGGAKWVGVFEVRHTLVHVICLR